MKQKPILTLTGLTLVVALTGCNGFPGSTEPEPTATASDNPVVLVNPSDPATPSETNTSTVEPTSTPSAETTITEAVAYDIREGRYIDLWARSISNHLYTEAILFRADLSLGSPTEALQDFLNLRIVEDVPDGFEVETEATVTDNFVIRIWHPDGYEYFSQLSAHVSRSDPPAGGSEPLPVTQQPWEVVDDVTRFVLYEIQAAAENYVSAFAMTPTESVLEASVDIPPGWEWSLDQDPNDIPNRVIRVWNPNGTLYDNQENAAYVNTFPQDDFRPRSNVDILEFYPIIDAQPPYPPTTETPTESPSPTPEGSPSPPPIVITPAPDRITNAPTPMPEPTGEPAA